MLDAGRTGKLTLALDGRPCDPSDQGTLTFFVESYVPAPRMLVFGAIDFAAAVVRIGKFLGYRVTVCDARPVFATERRFPTPTRSWWTGRTATWTPSSPAGAARRPDRAVRAHP